jgi:hypothetical protein
VEEYHNKEGYRHKNISSPHGSILLHYFFLRQNQHLNHLHDSILIMFQWNPLQDKKETWTPCGGWNASFSEMDQLQATSLFFHFRKRGCSEPVASCLAQMALFKQKNHGLRYSEEQEAMLQRLIQPFIH